MVQRRDYTNFDPEDDWDEDYEDTLKCPFCGGSGIVPEPKTGGLIDAQCPICLGHGEIEPDHDGWEDSDYDSPYLDFLDDDDLDDEEEY